MSKVLRVGLIGPGSIADERLIPALIKVPNAVFWSVLSRDEERARSFAAKHDATAPQPAQTDLTAFLSDPQLDAVIIASPDRLHAAQAVAAARAGKHIFVEKPMATSIIEAQQIVTACEDTKVALAVGYHLRSHAGHQAIRDYIEAGKLGQPQHMIVHWTMTADPSDWRAKKETGRWWSLAAVGTHALDMVRWLMQPECGEVVDIRAITSNAQYGGPDETAMVLLRFASGATAEVLSSVVFRAPRLIEIYGSQGTITAVDTLGPRGAGTIKINGQALEFTPVDPYEGELANFIGSIQSGTAPAVNAQEGLANVALLERISANCEGH